MISDRINEQSSWRDLTEGNKIYEPATSMQFNTGEWRTQAPVHDEAKCKQCYLCVPVCPDLSISVGDNDKIVFDMDHCKGCGICSKVCPFDAIRMEE